MKRMLFASMTLALAAPIAAQAPTSDPLPAPEPQSDQGVIAEAAKSAADGDFANYDRDGNGQLDKTEFASWCAARHSGEGGATSVPAASVAFRKADSDQNKAVSKAELGQYLAG